MGNLFFFFSFLFQLCLIELFGLEKKTNPRSAKGERERLIVNKNEKKKMWKYDDGASRRCRR
jgi:hypothetical protein